MRLLSLSGLGAAKRDGCRDAEGKFVPVPQCTGRKRAKLKPQERPEKPKKPRVVSKPTRAKIKAPAPTKPWLSSSPFTTEQTDRYNRYTHFEIDFNKEFDVEIDRIKKHVADTLEKYQTHQADIDIAESEINKYRRKLYDYYLSRFDLQSYYPPVSVVGPAKYPYQKKSKAAAREKKMITTWQKAVAEFDRAIYRITKGRTAKAVTFQWSELALAMNRLSFGKRYAEQKIKEAQFPNAEAFASTYRKRGRELHKDLIRNAVDRGTPIEYLAIKDYPDLLERAQVLHAPPEVSPKKARMEKKRAAAEEKPLTKDERDLLRLIGDEKMHLEDLNALLYKESGLTPYGVASALVMLELKNMIHQSAGKMFEATKPPKMPPAPLQAFAFRIEPKEEAIVKRIERGQKVGKDEVKFSHLLQYAHTYYEPEDIRSKLIADKERKAQMNHGSWAKFKLSKADDKKYGKIVLEMLQKPKGVHHESIIKILEPYVSGDHVMGLIGRLYLAGKITEVSKNRYKTAPGGYTPMQIKDVQRSNFAPYLGYVPTPRESRAGKKLMYMLAKNYTTFDATTLPRKNLDYWQRRSGTQGVKVFATFAYSADDAREQIRKGEVAAIHEAGGREAIQEYLVRPHKQAKRVPLSQKPIKDFYMYVKKGFRKPKSVGINEASFYQREMERYGRGTLYQVRARTADEARALIKARKEAPKTLAPRRLPPRAALIPEQLRLFGKVSYMPQAWERARGKRNYYLHAAHLSDGSILFIEKHTVGEWLRRKETIRVEYHAVNAYSEEHARMIIEAGGSKPYYLSIGHHYRTPKAAEQLRLFGFSGLSGDISTCAYWIATNGDWTCGSYLPTCEAQEPGACKIPLPAGYKFCSTTQKVKSDPKGRYKGKLITRCKTYRSRCLPDSGCIEDKLFPKPEVFKLDKKEVREIAASMAKEFNLLQKETGPALAREILDRGGLKAYRGETGTEEWAAMPLHLKRKSGMTMDEMASEMGFEHETAFRAAVEKAYPPGKKTVRRKTWKDYQDEAEQILIDQEQRSEYAYEEPVPF